MREHPVASAARRAAFINHFAGRAAAHEYCQKHGVPHRLFRIAVQLEAVKH